MTTFQSFCLKYCKKSFLEKYPNGGNAKSNSKRPRFKSYVNKHGGTPAIEKAYKNCQIIGEKMKKECCEDCNLCEPIDQFDEPPNLFKGYCSECFSNVGAHVCNKKPDRRLPNLLKFCKNVCTEEEYDSFVMLAATVCKNLSYFNGIIFKTKNVFLIF